eukprot:TRINITY_DN7688_c0_g1_i1.p1 TRINITY_DN7688_c0_g1~~TRINITY_DN7688_c0_g1_i1.p1  ORF type:complete len:330 (+),score=123.11 TRINITY_DN7688_c0_g1_i1:104-1093(+)
MSKKNVDPEKLLMETMMRLSKGDFDAESLLRLTRECNELEGLPPPEEMKGCIPDYLPPKEKANKYVELLWGDEDKVLMGEPASFTMPHYSIMPNFNMQDLEFFSAFCGLVKLSKEGYYASVEKELLKKRESLDNLAKWVYNPPKIVKGKSDPMSYKEHSKASQKGKDYATIFEEGPFGLLSYLFGENSSPQVHIHFTKSPELANFVLRLVDLLGRTEEEFAFIKKVSIKTLAKIGRYPNGVKEMKKHKSPIFSRLENMEENEDVKAILASIDGSTQPIDEKEDLKGLGCAVCGSLDNLKKCSRCFSKHYCGAQCQKDDWPIHKLNCTKK